MVPLNVHLGDVSLMNFRLQNGRLGHLEDYL